MGSLRYIPIVGEKQPIGMPNPFNGKINVLWIELYPHIFPVLLFTYDANGTRPQKWIKYPVIKS
jgi:hypothetical protein